jgi:hypothetical protein
MRYALLVVFAAAQVFANTITSLEYSWDSPAPPGSGTPLAITPGNVTQVIGNIPIAALSPGLHVLYIRALDDSAGWGQPQSEWVYKFETLSPSNREILELQISFDGGPATIYDVPDLSEAQLIRNIPIASLSSGLHVLNIRARDNFGNWGQPQSEWVYKFETMTPSNREILELQISFDGGPATIYDVPDLSETQLVRNIPIASLSDGLHILSIRARDNFGNWGQPQSEWVYKFAQPVNDTLNIIQAEVKIDSQPPVYFDVSDTSHASLIAQIPANTIGFGTHTACIRFQDERNIWSVPDCRNFFVIPGNPNADSGYVAGAECWINVDPGEGNGFALLPADGDWDELTETAYVELTDSIPMGIHILGVRVRDDAGQWSNVMLDTISVGPLLVIQSSGSDVILTWTNSNEPHEFTVRRSTQPGTGFSPIGTTNTSAYTDVGIINSLSAAYYDVSFQLAPGAQNNFRLPDKRQRTAK